MSPGPRTPRTRYAGPGTKAKSRDEDQEELRAALYSRVSTEEQASEGFSMDMQMDRLESYVKARGWTEAGRYVDAGATGTNMKRQGYQLMMSEIDKWDVIVVVKMDRVHRNIRNFTGMMDQLKAKDKDFVSVTEALDTSTAMGRFVQDIIQRIAQLESEVTGERTFAGMAQKATVSKELGQPAPYGYRWDHGVCPECKHRQGNASWFTDQIVCGECGADMSKSFRSGFGEWIKKDDEAQIVLQIFSLYASEAGSLYRGTKPGRTHKMSMHAIALELGWCTCHRHKKTTRRSDCSGSSRVRYIVNNVAYVGYFVWGNEVHKGAHKPLINRDLFERAQSRRWKMRVVLPD